MTQPPSTEKIVNALAAMVAAINNIRLYPPSSALIANSVAKAYEGIQAVVTSSMPLLIAESEDGLLISGEPLSIKGQQSPQVHTFVTILSSLRIKSIILKKAVSLPDFRNFLFILSKSAEDVELEGGIQQLTASIQLENVSITPALNVTGKLTAQTNDLDNTDINLIKSFLGERKVMESDYMRLGEKASDSRWVNEFFKTGINFIKTQQVTLSDTLLPDTISKMVIAFGRSTPRENWGRVSSSITKAIAESDIDLLAIVMAKSHHENLFNTLVKTLGDDEYVELFSGINQINDSQSYADRPLTDEEKKQFDSVLTSLKKNKKTSMLKERIKQKILSEKKKIALEKVHLQNGINKLLQGDLSPLTDPFIVDAIPGRVLAWFNTGKKDMGRTLINKISDGLLNQSLKTRSFSSSCLFNIGKIMDPETDEEDITWLSHNLNIWVKFETEVTYNYKEACQMLQNYARRLLSAYRFNEANLILETFSFIYYGQIQKPYEIREIAGSVLANIATEKTFSLIFDEFLVNARDEGKNAYYTLIRLGEISVIPLLDTLRTSENMSDRVRIINALTEIGKPALPYVVERIKTGSSWFYMRNLIKILSSMGSEEHLEILKPLLNHSNEVIPKAALNCAFDIGGDERPKFLIQALNIPNDDLRKLAADLLGKTGSEDGVFPLTQLFKAKAAESSEAKNALDLTICDALKRIGSKKAIPALKAIVTQKSILGLSSHSSALRHAASGTLKYLQKLPTGTTDSKGPAKDSHSPAASTVITKTEDILTENPNQLEALVDEYVRQKNIHEAVKLLFRMTVKFAREKNFLKAEALREKLFEVDPMALSEIVQSGDIIEEEKNNALLNDYLNIWGNLYERLDNDEANSLFFSIKTEEYPPDHVVIAQQGKNDRLYFINRGQLKIVYNQGGGEFFLKMLGAGDIAGEDTFFPITVSTVSLVTLSHVKVGYLDRETLKSLKGKHPLLEDKLLDYCSLGDGINTLVTKKGLERRQQKRRAVNGKALVQFADPNGSPLGKPFKGNLLDISTGGVSFLIKTAKKDTTRLLLGRKLNMAIGIRTQSEPIEINRMGTIISARDKDAAHFSLHLKFDDPMDEQIMAGIETRALQD